MSTHAPQPGGPLGRLLAEIEHAAHLLPAQGPINVFIHHNTLHAFEDRPFLDAVREGGQVFGCQPFLPKSRYRAELEKGRIRFDELREVLREELGGRADEMVAGLARRIDLRMGMLLFTHYAGPPAEVLWFLEETDALVKVREGVPPEARVRLVTQARHWVLRDLRGGNEAGPGTSARQRPPWLAGLLERFSGGSIEEWPAATWEAFTLGALWQVCRTRAAELPPPPPPPPPVRHRDLLLRAAGVDTDLWVHEPLVRLCGAFLDQGVAHWPLPNRERGLYRAFLALNQTPGQPGPRWLSGLAAESARLEREGTSPLQLVHESLADLGVGEAEWGAFLPATLLALGGWAGIIRQVEQRGGRARFPAPPGSLVEFLAVRLLLERFALREAARQALGYQGPLAGLRQEAARKAPPTPGTSPELRAFQVFQLAQALGWPPGDLHRAGRVEWAELVGEIEGFSEVERRRAFQLAYELRFVRRSLDALALRAALPDTTPARPRFQAVFCLDEREESFRRHLEEVAPDCETFGAAGFYGVAMYYRGEADAHYVPKCPIVVTPNHWVEEEPDERHEEAERLKALRQAIAQATFGFQRGSQSFALGAVLSAALGALASVPLVARVLFPLLSSRVEALFAGFLQSPGKTRLTLERSVPRPGPENGARGYTAEEMAEVAERQLRDIGLTRRFARLVLIHGHGSDSPNNPHKSAYDCGACGGSPGGANARALAAMLNDPRIRATLQARGLAVPEETWFVGGLHNTCDDSVAYYDLHLIPPDHREEFAAARRDVEEACGRNAHERCRRFYSAPLGLSFEDARRHVEARSHDMSQTRPELGHATNALCVVARRSRTRGLFLDRRAFLTSYDPTQDDTESTVLTRLLQAAVPVCGGINLEYYFSHVDPTGWGCGTKLPHNVAAMLGVINGAGGDLRTGLPWQMVEAHEPVRLVFLVETTPEAVLRIMQRHPGIGRMVRNGWVHLAVMCPDTGRIRAFREGRFEDYTPQVAALPVAAASVDWYRGWRDHLDFALIGEAVQ